MIKHILKLLWNQKSKYFTIFIEQVFVTIILMLCIVSIANSYAKYNDPGILNTDQNVLFGYMIPRESLADFNPDDLAQSMTAINMNLKKQPYMRSITKSMFLTPYLRPGGNYFIDSISIDEKKFECYFKFADSFAGEVFTPEIKDGRWLTDEKLDDGSFQTVITQQFMDAAGWSNAIGKKFSFYGRDYTIVGIIEGAKQQPFEPSPVSAILPIEIYGNSFFIEYVAKVTNNEKGTFFNDFYKEFRRYITKKEIEPIISDINVWKQKTMLPVLTSIILQSVPTFFLLIFSFIGTFGLFWLNSKKRVKEFALRIALGSTSQRLLGFIITESLIITSLAIFPALLISMFIYEFSFIHIVSVLFTFLIMITFSLISAWYPAWKISKTNPAEALQYE